MNVKNPESQTCLIENCLIGESEDKPFIVYENSHWQDYCLDISVKLPEPQSKDQSVGICFGLEDVNNYHQLRIEPIANSNKARISVLRKTISETINLAQFQLPWKPDLWLHVQIQLNQNDIEVVVDKNKSTKIPVKDKITGGTGLILEGETTAYFDDIHVREISQGIDQANGE